MTASLRLINEERERGIDKLRVARAQQTVRTLAAQLGGRAVLGIHHR